MRFVEALSTQPRTALAARTISFNFVERFFVVWRATRLNAFDAISAQSLPLEMAQSVPIAELLYNLNIAYWKRFSIKGSDGSWIWWNDESFSVFLNYKWIKKWKINIVKCYKNGKNLFLVKKLKSFSVFCIIYLSFDLWLCSSQITTIFLPTVFRVALHFDFLYSLHRYLTVLPAPTATLVKMFLSWSKRPLRSYCKLYSAAEASKSS